MARGRRTFDNAFLEGLREIPILVALGHLGLYWKIDPDFRPLKSGNTRRLYVSVGANVVELLLTDQKWYDPRRSLGGGGVIDLTMYLLGLDFVGAVKALTEHANEERPG